MRNEWRRWMDDSLSLLESGFSQWRTRKEQGWHQLFLSLVCVAWDARVGDSALRNRERDGRRSIVSGNWWRWNNDQEWINHQQILLRRPRNWGRRWCCHLGQDAKSLRSQLRKWRSLQGVERSPKIMMKFRDKPYSCLRTDLLVRQWLQETSTGQIDELGRQNCNGKGHQRVQWEHPSSWPKVSQSSQHL